MFRAWNVNGADEASSVMAVDVDGLDAIRGLGTNGMSKKWPKREDGNHDNGGQTHNRPVVGDPNNPFGPRAVNPKRGLRLAPNVPTFAADDGVRIHYVDQGKGPALVFVHGWMMSHRVFDRQMEPLSKSYRCIALDLRGCGDSESRGGTHTLSRFADDVHNLLEGLELDHVTIVGWSMGGGVTMQMLERHGTKRIDRVCLVDFPPKLVEAEGRAERVCARLNEDREGFLQRFVPTMFQGSPSAEVRDHILAQTAKCATSTGCEMYQQMGAGDSLGSVYDTPAMLAFPEGGWFRKSLADWRTIFPKHIVPEFPSSGHCPFLEESNAFNAALVQFVTRGVDVATRSNQEAK